MIKRLLSICFLILAALVLISGCTTANTTTNAQLDKEFSLAIGQTTTIQDEGLSMKLKDVVSDSRCPQGVVCIWAGEVSCLVEIDYGGKNSDLVLTQSGDPTVKSFDKYQFTFHVEPYPQAGKEIAKGDYRLLMTVQKVS